MASHRFLPLLPSLLLGMVALALSSHAAPISGIRTDVIDTAIVGGSEADFPLNVEMNFAAGSTKIIYTRPGEFSFDADPTLGDFTGVTIYGTRMPLEHGGFATIPSTGRQITVTFSNFTDGEGKAHTRVTMTIE